MEQAWPFSKGSPTELKKIKPSDIPYLSSGIAKSLLSQIYVGETEKLMESCR